MEIGATFDARDRKTWRGWLARHHAATDEIWLVRHKKHTGVACVPYDAAVEEALCFGWIDGLVKRVDEATYVIRFTPRKPGSVWSASNKERVAKMTSQGRMTPAGQALVDDAVRSGAWDRVEEELRESAAPPPELVAALAADPSAKAFYDSMTESQRRGYNRWVGQARRTETRVRRAKQAAQRCARGLKPGMA